jgi:hypothetical protein
MPKSLVKRENLSIKLSRNDGHFMQLHVAVTDNVLDNVPPMSRALSHHCPDLGRFTSQFHLLIRGQCGFGYVFLMPRNEVLMFSGYPAKFN